MVVTACAPAHRLEERSGSSPTQQETAQPSPSNSIEQITCCLFQDLASNVNPTAGQRMSEKLSAEGEGRGWGLVVFMIFSSITTKDLCELLSCLSTTNQQYLQGISGPNVLLFSWVLTPGLWVWWQVPQVKTPTYRSAWAFECQEEAPSSFTWASDPLACSTSGYAECLTLLEFTNLPCSLQNSKKH